MGGLLADWDRSGDLRRITVPTLVIAAERDTLLRWMADQLPHSGYWHRPDGGHHAMVEDDTYLAGLLGVLRDLRAGATA